MGQRHDRHRIFWISLKLMVLIIIVIVIVNSNSNSNATKSSTNGDCVFVEKNDKTRFDILKHQFK